MRVRVVMAVVMLVALATHPVHAEPVGRHVELTGLAGFTVFDLTPNEFTGRPLKDVVHFGGRLGVAWAPALTTEVAIGFNPTQEDTVSGRGIDDVPLGLNVLWSPLRWRTFRPYLLVGGASDALSLTSDGSSGSHTAAVAGVGFRYWLNDIVGIRAEATDVLALEDNPIGGNKSQTYTVAGGITFGFAGRARDTDDDGVPGGLRTRRPLQK